MNDKILVSVLCVTYNNEKHIAQALESIISQKTNFLFEIIVHDDASRDHTAEIIKEYQIKYPDLIKGIYQKENVYSKDIRLMDEFMIPIAKGKYIAFCEGDDYWNCNNKLQRQVDFLERHKNYSCCTHNSVILDCKTGLKRKYNVNFMKNQSVNIVDILDWPTKYCFHSSSMLIRNINLDKLPAFYFKINSFSDFTLALSMALRGKVYYFTEIMSTYRQNIPDSWSFKTSTNKDLMLQNRKNAIKMYKLFNIETKGLYKQKVTECIYHQLFYIYLYQNKIYKILNPKFWTIIKKYKLYQMIL